MITHNCGKAGAVEKQCVLNLFKKDDKRYEKVTYEVNGLRAFFRVVKRE